MTRQTSSCRRLLACGAAALLLAGSGAATAKDSRSYVAEKTVARSDKPFADKPANFQFVVVGDRTGRHRPGVFEQAMKQVDALQPEFVINVGDLVEGYSEDMAEVGRQWDELKPAIDGLGMPFFYVPGNHDLSNDGMRKIWRERFGADYYHFVYKDVLFIVLNTEDPPQPERSRTALFQQYGGEAMATVMRALQGDRAQAQALFASDPKLAELAKKIVDSDQVNFSADQVASVKKALAANPDARWTFLLMHRPGWRYDSPQFKEIERLLQGRRYTMLAGHFHKYAYEQRDGHDYIQLGTTGGTHATSPDDPGSVDHVTWITMTDNGPSIANLRLDGMFDRKGPTPAAPAAQASPAAPGH